MNIEVSKRRSGKTTKAILKSAKTKAKIVVFSREEAQRVFNVATGMELDIPFPVTIDEFLNKPFVRHHHAGLILDNVELLLARVFSGHKIHLAMMSGAESEKPKPNLY